MLHLKKRNHCKIFLCLCVVFILFLSIGDQIYAETQENTGGVGARLNGNYAYISDVGMVADDTTSSGTAMRTGTSPWDGIEETGEPGNDTTDLDNIVRSFDNVNYTVYLKNKVRKDAPYQFYETGTLYFEFVVRGTKDQIIYEEQSMGWLSSKKEIAYTIKEEERDGEICQVLSGSYLMEPSESNPAAIGEGYQELAIVLRVLAMENGQTIQPEYTFWLEDNEESDYKTVTPQTVQVTAAPRYNIQLKTSESRVKYIDTFDFLIGNDLAANKDVGNVYGRVDALGVTIQIMGKTAQHGLRGCEIPTGDIEFDLNLQSAYVPAETGNAVDVSDAYGPLLWSVEGNNKNQQQQDERTISGKYKFASGGAPFNQGTSPNDCYNGGKWTGSQEGGTVHIKVSNYEIDFSQLPYADANVSGAYTYYDPNTTKNYWDIQMACFSAGEIWILQPFYDQNGVYIVDQYGIGSFNTTISDSKLTAMGKSGQQLNTVSDNSNQQLTTDDQKVLAMALELPGTIDQGIDYQKYQNLSYGAALTDGCFENGKDWIIRGGKLNIQESLKHNSAEGMNVGVGYDDLIKFDDVFFELEQVKKGGNAGLENMTDQFLYGAKPDKKGWNHQGKKPEEDGYDEEMINATADDLIFFPTLEELKANGYTCVAVLWEARGVASSQSTNCYIGLEGTVKSTALSGGVYMVTHSARAWNKLNVQKAVAEKTGKEIAALTDADYIAYMQSNSFPSRGKEQRQYNYDAEYPEAFWQNDASHNSGLAAYKKSVYDVNGYTGGSAGISYGDSCLVVDYATKIVKDTAQQTAGNQGSKNSYDMDTNQRIADYILKPSVLRTAGESFTEGIQQTVGIYIEDTLPSGLTYVMDSAFWGGQYIQNGEGKQGSVEGGVELEPEVIKNADGTTTLRWYLENVKIQEDEETFIDPIYYSCEIGTIGVEETDVKNNDQLLNRAVIWGKDEPRREVNLANGNLAEKSILVSKLRASSLSKIADQSFIDIGDEMGFTLNIGNNGDNSMEIIGVDSLPYPGDEMGSDFEGKCLITELSVKNLELLENIQLYYTTDEHQRGKTSEAFTSSDFQDNSVWTKMSVDSSTGKVTIPDSFAPAAIAAVGNLPEQQTLKMHINLYLENAKAGDKVVNRLTQGDMESDARTYIVSRTLEGNVWIDEDKDGMYQTDEEKVNGVTAVLVKLKENGDPQNMEDYEPYLVNGKESRVETGYQMDVETGMITEYDIGKYKFVNLPAGVFGVLFENGSFDLFGYQATAVDAGEDDTIDSDAYPEYESQRLVRAYILNIDMPKKEKMTSALYQSKYHDLGLHLSEASPDTGVDNDMSAIVEGLIVFILISVGAAEIYIIIRRIKKRRMRRK